MQPAPVDYATKPLISHSEDVSTLSAGDVRKNWYLVAVFFSALAIRLIFNFVDSHPDAAFSCDASEYLRDAQGVLKVLALPVTFWFDAIPTLWGAGNVSSVREALSPLSELVIAGPAFPAFIAFSYAVSGQVADYIHSFPPIFVQSLLTSLTCVLIALATQKSFQGFSGLIAGTLAAMYPGFIVGSGRLYSESFSCFLTCSVIALCVYGLSERKMRPWQTLVLGATLACLQQTRSVMVILTICGLAVAWMCEAGARRWRNLALCLCGFAMVFLPWLCVQKMAFGTAKIVVDRAGSYNLFIGTNTQTSGWLSYPYPDGSGTQSKSLMQLTKDSIAVSPSRWIRLMLDKPIRLFKMPWNDFRTSIGAFGVGSQTLFHQTMLLLGAVGVACYVCGFGNRRDVGTRVFRSSWISDLRSRWLAPAGFVALVGATQLVYLLFITVPRYNLCAIPSILIFAACALNAIICNPVEESAETKRRASLVLSGAALLAILQINTIPLFATLIQIKGTLVVAFAISMILKAAFVLAFLKCLADFVKTKSTTGGWPIWSTVAVIGAIIVTFGCLPLNAHGRSMEWSKSLRKGESVSRTFDLDSDQLSKLSQRPCYVLVDTSSFREIQDKVFVSINGTPLRTSMIPAMPFVENLAAFKLKGSSGLYLEFEDILRGLASASGKDVVDLRQWAIVPVEQRLLEKLLAEKRSLTVTLEGSGNTDCIVFGGYSRKKRFTVPSIDRYSWEKAFYGVENPGGLSDIRYDQEIQTHAVDETQTPFLALLSAPPVAGAGCRDLVGLKNATATGALRHVGITAVPSYGPNDLWLIRVHGRVRSQGASCAQVTVKVTSQVAGATPETAGAQKPKTVGWGANSGAFEPVPGVPYEYVSPWASTSISCGSEWRSVDTAFPLQPGGMPGRLRSIEATIGGESDGIEVSELRIDVSLMPSFPTGLGYELF